MHMCTVERWDNSRGDDLATPIKFIWQLYIDFGKIKLL